MEVIATMGSHSCPPSHGLGGPQALVRSAVSAAIKAYRESQVTHARELPNVELKPLEVVVDGVTHALGVPPTMQPDMEAWLGTRMSSLLS